MPRNGSKKNSAAPSGDHSTSGSHTRRPGKSGPTHRCVRRGGNTPSGSRYFWTQHHYARAVRRPSWRALSDEGERAMEAEFAWDLRYAIENPQGVGMGVEPETVAGAAHDIRDRFSVGRPGESDVDTMDLGGKRDRLTRLTGGAQVERHRQVFAERLLHRIVQRPIVGHAPVAERGNVLRHHAWRTRRRAVGDRYDPDGVGTGSVALEEHVSIVRRPQRALIVGGAVEKDTRRRAVRTDDEQIARTARARGQVVDDESPVSGQARPNRKNPSKCRTTRGGPPSTGTSVRSQYSFVFLRSQHKT